jgi:AcrR family transcriptional regulator
MPQADAPGARRGKAPKRGKAAPDVSARRANGKSVPRKARNAEDKEVRREELLAVARRLFETTPYEEITMADVARAAGLAKGTPYLYFESKEELFLSVLDELLARWFVSVDRMLDEERGELTPERLIQIFAGAIEERDDLYRLLSLLGRVLERNLSFEAAARYKRRIWTRMTHTSAKLEAKLPYLGRGEGFRLLLFVQVLIVGLREFADVSPVVQRVIKEFELPGFDAFDFDTEFAIALQLHLKSLEQRGRP